MKNKLNTDFIHAIQEVLPADVNIVNAIVDILGIGKEASYRRLRNEVPFSFHEATLIACKLGISLDQVAGNYKSKTGIFNLNLVHSDDALTNYRETLIRYKKYLGFMKDDSASFINYITNSIPYVLYLPYKYIMKFRLCRWLHQTDKLTLNESLENITIPEHIVTLQTDVFKGLQDIPQSYMIWDNDTFYSFLKEINYFSKLKFITKNDLDYLKKELHHLLDATEKMATEGCYTNGNKVDIYLSNIHFQTSYCYLEKGKFRVALIRLYSVNSIDTFSPEICRMQKEGVQILKRYSTLITESGQIQRIKFFSDQRRFVDEL